MSITGKENDDRVRIANIMDYNLPLSDIRKDHYDKKNIVEYFNTDIDWYKMEHPALKPKLSDFIKILQKIYDTCGDAYITGGNPEIGSGIIDIEVKRMYYDNDESITLVDIS